MEKSTRDYIIKELFTPGFIEYQQGEILLEETEESGKSELRVQLKSDENLCITNVDKKHTNLLFFQEHKSLDKRVDHMIFERQKEDLWKLYLIEMKSSVGANKWIEVKGKFRASYLLAQAIAGMLELTITETVMYTTFEKVKFRPLDTTPTARRVRSGQSLIPMEAEWKGEKFGLNFGTRISFRHVPLLMYKQEGCLKGVLAE